MYLNNLSSNQLFQWIVFLFQYVFNIGIEIFAFCGKMQNKKIFFFHASKTFVDRLNNILMITIDTIFPRDFGFLREENYWNLSVELLMAAKLNIFQLWSITNLTCSLNMKWEGIDWIEILFSYRNISNYNFFRSIYVI